MVREILKYVSTGAVAYLCADILISITSALRLLILRVVIDGFTVNENKLFAGKTELGMLCAYFLAKAMLDNFKDKMAFLSRIGGAEG